MSKDEALKMAIEIMQRYLKETPLGNQPHMIAHKAEEAIIACKEALDTKQPTRLEVIDADGRTYTNWKVKDMEFSYQDDGRTLKIFIKE